MKAESIKIKTALLSVSDKTNLETLARVLHKHQVQIISSGGTRDYLLKSGIPVTSVESVTGNPEAFGGRMKTLSFQLGSGILFNRFSPKDVKEAQDLGILPIDLVVCNLYPFEETARRGADLGELIENIDVGGPTMIRAAAKNFHGVCVCTETSQYPFLIDQLEKNEGAVELSLRKDFALAAFRLTSYYDSLICRELERESESPPTLLISPLKTNPLRYGENPHQKGWLARDPFQEGLAHGIALQGKELSYNNFLDADAGHRLICDLDKIANSGETVVSIIKHSNPCGVALAKSAVHALELAWKGDPVSSFGSIVCFNREVGQECAQFLSSRFVEVILAPGFSPSALAIFKEKKNLRLLCVRMMEGTKVSIMVRSITGGYLLQEEDTGLDREFKSVTKAPFPLEKKRLMDFSTMATKYMKSNAIGLFIEEEGTYQLIGAGMGNPNRLVSIQQAVEKATENGHRELGKAILVSDAFFPFPDNIEAAGKAGIKLIIQPGGSIKDADVIRAADERGISMVFSHRRHFRH
jgi:phosphoribosylaminoimidazolecarboxamide formyltransferase/IMP cyclohydrolase